MTKLEQELAAQMLELASNTFGNHGCNDWDWPDTWSKEEKERFVREFHEWNGDPEEYDPEDVDLPDYAVMDFLAAKLKGEAQ